MGRYPTELVRTETIPGVGEALLRPVRPDDGPGIVRFFERLSPDDVHMRFFSAMHELPPHHLDLLTGIDFDRDMALLLFEPQSQEILGIVRLVAAPDPQRAEFAITVRTDMHHHGIGELLMHRALDYARTRNLKAVYGDILAENHITLRLVKKLGFSLHRDPASLDVVRATLELARPSSDA